MLKTCPKCGSLMIAKKEGDKVVLVCQGCGYREASEGEHRFETKTKEKSEIIVVEKDVKLLPTTKKKCPRCGYGEAYYELRQTRAADEPPTQFFICKKCGYKWREY